MTLTMTARAETGRPPAGKSERFDETAMSGMCAGDAGRKSCGRGPRSVDYKQRYSTLDRGRPLRSVL